MRRHTTLLAFALLALGRGLIAQELKERAHLKDNPAWPNCLALSPDAKMLAAIVRMEQKAGVKLWDVASGKEITTFACQTRDLEALAFSADGRLLAAAGDASVMAWDVAARKPLLMLRQSIHPVNTLAFSADGKRLGAAGAGGVRLWDLASGKELSSFRAKGGRAFSPDLRTLASPDYPEIDLWDVKTGKRRTTLSEHRGPVRYVEYSRDGKTLVAASDRFERKPKHQYTGEIRLWDVATGRERAVFQEGIGYVWPTRLSPDGKTLAALERRDGYELHLKLLDVATGKQRVVHPPAPPRVHPHRLHGGWTALRHRHPRSQGDQNLGGFGERPALAGGWGRTPQPYPVPTPTRPGVGFLCGRPRQRRLFWSHCLRLDRGVEPCCPARCPRSASSASALF